MNPNSTNPTSKRTPFFRRVAGKGAFRIALFAIAALITIIALWHAEENWRGARAWRNYRQQQIDAGKAIDPRALVPARVPDEENFAMTPFLAPLLDYEPGTQTRRDPSGAERAQMFADGIPDFPKLTNRNFEVDLVALANELRHPSKPTQVNAAKFAKNPYMAPPLYGRAIEGADVTDRKEAAKAILDAFSMYSPAIEELRAASHRRYARFNIAYDNPDKIAILLPHLGVLRKICRVVSTRATAELALGQTDKALDDVGLALYLAEAPRSEAIIVSQLVRIASLHDAMQPLIIGLRNHQWSDADIQRLQPLLDHIDLIGGMKRAIDGEVAVFADSCFEQLKAASNPLKLLRSWSVLTSPSVSSYSDNPVADALFYIAVPRGWFDFEQLKYHQLHDQTVAPVFDLQARCIYPEKAAQADQYLVGLKALGSVHNVLHHEVFALVGLPAIARLTKKVAGSVAEIDLTRVACGLERYRLAHGNYPDNLNSLVPQFISTLPNDPIKGGPLHYRRTQDTFVLYSIGLNGVDDDGKVVTKSKKNPRPDAEKGDWVWGDSVNP